MEWTCLPAKDLPDVLPQAGLTHEDEGTSSFSAYRYHNEDPVFSAMAFG